MFSCLGSRANIKAEFKFTLDDRNEGGYRDFLVDQALYFKFLYNCWPKITEAVSQSGTRLDLSMPQWKSAPHFENKIGRG